LAREFVELDGENLARKAERENLQPADLPKAFAKVKSIVAPPRQQAIDRKRLERQRETLTGQIDKARRNLVLLDPDNIPAAQAEIRRLESECQSVNAELSKRPPSEADVNAEATEVLRSLYWLGILFRSAAQECGRDPDEPEDWQDLAEGGAYFVGSAKTCGFREYLRKIAGITVHTQVEGWKTRRRHVLKGGEIALHPVRVKTGDLNPHNPGKSRACCR
jgi:hypothetical protein